jgi:hypothetical protein
MEQHEREVLAEVKYTLKLLDEAQQALKNSTLRDKELKQGQVAGFRATLEKSVKIYADSTINKDSFYRYNMFLTDPPPTAEELRSRVVTEDHKNDEQCCNCKSGLSLKKKHTCRFCSSTTCNNSKCYTNMPFNEINSNPRYKNITYKVLVCKVCEESIKKGWPQSLKMIDNIEDYMIGVKESVAKIMHALENSGQ